MYRLVGFGGVDSVGGVEGVLEVLGGVAEVDKESAVNYLSICARLCSIPIDDTQS